jgi:hypothetical protein
MPTLLLRSAFQFHDASAKNQAVVTSHFNVGFDPIAFGDTNATQLCSDLADKWGFMAGIGATTPYSVSAYKRGGAKLGLPVAKVQRNPAGTPKVVGVVPEACVCLSYYAGVNAPRYRGRMYLPAWLLGATSSSMATTVPSALRTACESLVGLLHLRCVGDPAPARDQGDRAHLGDHHRVRERSGPGCDLRSFATRPRRSPCRLRPAFMTYCDIGHSHSLAGTCGEGELT